MENDLLPRIIGGFHKGGINERDNSAGTEWL